MKNIVDFLFLVLCAGLIVGFIITVAWFCFAMVVNFWKIYGKKLKQEVLECDHSNIIYDEGHSDKVWKCTGCGRRF